MSVNVKLKETNTNPIIIHANGKSKKTMSGQIGNEIYSSTDIIEGNTWPDMVYSFLENQKPISLEEDLDVTIVTWKGGKYLNKETILERCLRYYDFPLLTLEWPEGKSFWEGSKYKVFNTLKAINDGTINTKYVMWFDTSDVLLLRHPKVILESYQELFSDYGLVFNAERNNYPSYERVATTQTMKGVTSTPELIKEWKDVRDEDDLNEISSFKYMNSGALVGKTETLKRFLDIAANVDPKGPINDTVMCRVAQKRMLDEVKVDRECKLFGCLWGVTESEVEVTTENE